MRRNRGRAADGIERRCFLRTLVDDNALQAKFIERGKSTKHKLRGSCVSDRRKVQGVSIS